MIVTDPCSSDSVDWLYGLICIKSSNHEFIRETIIVTIGSNTFLVRVSESEESRLS